MTFRPLITVLVGLATLAGCAGSKPVDRAEAATVSYPGSDAGLVFAAAKKILTEDGFIVVEESPEDLFLMATIPPGGQSRRILAGEASDAELARKDHWEATVQVYRRPEDVGVRFSVQSVRTRSFGSDWGYEIEDEKVYRAFTSQLKGLVRTSRPEARARESSDRTPAQNRKKSR